MAIILSDSDYLGQLQVVVKFDNLEKTIMVKIMEGCHHGNWMLINCTSKVNLP